MQKIQFKVCSREDRHRLEQRSLAPFAKQSDAAYGSRRYAEPEHAYRTAFQRDRDRIIHSRAFRRLKHKRQVFLTNTGDHYRTRLTHTMEVSQIGRTIARALGLNEDLTEAIALGHDLGHTPFGHLGEIILNDILQGKYADRDGFPRCSCGGFKHNYQSLRVVDCLELKYEFPGLNLTAPVREGILKHTGLKRGTIRYPDLDLSDLHFDHDHAFTLEAQAVAIADEVAQRTHDLEDGIRAGLVDIEAVRELEIVGMAEKSLGMGAPQGSDSHLYRNRLINGLINLLVSDIIETTLKKLESFSERKQRLADFDEFLAGFSKGIDPLQKKLNKFIYERIIYQEIVRRADEQAKAVLLGLFLAYSFRPELLPDDAHHFRSQGEDEAALARTICDHIAGMTDNFAVSELRRFVRKGVLADDIRTDLLQMEWMQ